MLKFPDKIVKEARSWVGTPYHHQAATKRYGVDCVGLIVGVGKSLAYFGTDFDDLFRQFDGYSRTPNPVKMRRGLELFLEPAGLDKNQIPTPGLIGWFEWREDLPMHLAIFAEFAGRPTMIHSFKPVGRCVEHTLDETWRGRINSFWKYRGS